jgi:hypothetical protein
MADGHEQSCKEMTYSFEKCIEKLENELKSMYVELDSVNAELKDLNEKFSDYHENAHRKIGKLKDNNLKAQNQFYQIVHEKDLIIEKLQKEASIKLNLFVMTNRDYSCNKSIFEFKRIKKHKSIFFIIQDEHRWFISSCGLSYRKRQGPPNCSRSIMVYS